MPQHQTAPTGQLPINGDNDDPSLFPAGDYCDMTETDGEHNHWVKSPRGRSVQFRILAFARGHRVRLKGYALSIRSQAVEEIER